MGDRQNPIKFGPEWLRNLSRERNAMSNNPNSLSSGSGVNSATGGLGVTNPNSGAGVSSPPGAIGVTNSSPGSGVSSPTGAVGVTSSSGSASNPLPGPSRERSSSHNSNKVQLAKLRYGREEMLALYDRNTESPPQLKNIDILYQSRSQPPTALNTTFEEQDNIRSSHTSGMMPLGERYGMGRAFSGRGFMGRGYLGRGSDGRGRSRGQFIRPPPAGSKRPGGRANWRQLPRDDREEWRSVSTRSRPQDKWDRDWGDRPPTSEKSHPWNPNRRTWAGREATNTEDNLPEWAVENAGACGGTFDSSGAFHGYSNDDSNLPRSQENAYSLARSHTHGSFVRQKTAGEGSEEWWASEKAKKLSPKRFDAGGIKFKKPPSVGMSEPGASDTNKSTVNRYESLDEIPVKESSAIVNYDESSQVSSGGNDNNATGAKFVESKTFDSHMRSDIGIEEANDERGNFQSVMITPNNSLRQKHQNIGLPINEGVGKLNRKPGILHLSRASTNTSAESTLKKPNMLTEDKIAEDIFELTLDEKTPINSVSPLLNPAIPVCLASVPPPPIHQLPKPITMGLQSQTLNLSLNQNNKLPPVRQSTGMHSNMMQQGRINNSALNASLGLPLDGGNLGIPLQGVPPPVLPNPGIGNSGANMGNTLQGPVGTGAMQSGATGLPGYSASLAWMTTPDVRDNSLFLGQASNNSSQLQGSADFQLTNNTHQNMAWPGHGLQHSASQSSYGSSLYSNMMPQSAAQTPPAHNMTDMWYYEDPKQIIQGPFTSQEMFNWYRGGFFTSSLMVRRACDAVMRPLGSYGPIVPFAPRELMPYQLPGNNLLNNQQSGLGLGVINIPNMTISNSNPVDTIQFGSVDMMRNPINNQNSMVESLWSQPTASSDLMWMQPPPINSHNENRVNNLSMFFWDQQPSAMISNSMLPEGIHKEMKTEDQILEQLRASQNISTSQTLTFMTEPDIKRPESSVAKPNDNFSTSVTATPNMEELQKLIQKETLVSTPPPPIELIEVSEEQVIGKIVNPDSNITEVNASKPVTVTKSVYSKTSKQTKSEGEKITRKGEKNKNEKVKKSKEEKKEEATEKVKEKEETDSEKRSAEPSPSKSKKEDKVLKKDLEKEKKELVKDGFTIVKGSEKNVNKENKKKAEELKAAEELERKKKEDEEKLAAVEEKKKKQLDTSKKQQEEQQQQQQKQISELIMKKAPWSVVSNQVSPAITKDGLNLAEIQRLEREKKLEQIKEQQHMMQLIAQQQAAALARDQEIQAGLGWAKKKPSNNNTTGQTLTEIQSEARKQAVVTAAALQILEEPQIPMLPPNNHIPWSNTHNGGGFWDTQPSQISKPEPSVDTTKTPETSKIKKKRNLITITKKEPSPAAEFENWCSVELASWSSKIDVPTFVGFLKDIESPYEVKDYVKCYLGESKDSSDFARQFLERRSKLLRVGMVTPSDDLCSPAIAINPRTISSSDYQEVKSKGKKIKKNKMLKVDSRILGFSVTAAEDRINVGDIDTA